MKDVGILTCENISSYDTYPVVEHSRKVMNYDTPEYIGVSILNLSEPHN